MTEKEDLDIGVVLQYTVYSPNLKKHGGIDADSLVRHARDCGFRGVSVADADPLQEKLVKESCTKYGMTFCEKRPAIPLDGGPDILAKLISARLAKQNIYLQVDLAEDGTIANEDVETMDILRKWIDRFGHAYFEARPDKDITTNANAHIFKNWHAPYQIYVFLHKPLPAILELDNVPEIQKAMWIDTRKEIDFKQDGNKLTLTLKRDDEDDDFNIHGLRLQAHRPEDEMGPTKF